MMFTMDRLIELSEISTESAVCGVKLSKPMTKVGATGDFEAKKVGSVLLPVTFVV